jgi:hypothetical protein
MVLVERWLPPAWSVALAVFLLGPALGPGYVLSYDMVWVPQLTIHADVWGLGSALPRAVPSDLVVAVVDTVVPAMVLQKLVLLGCLVAGGWGAARLVRPGPVAGPLVAVSVYQWNPFVAERLLIGHWPLLVGYACLPWVISAAIRWRRQDKLPTALLVLLPLGSLSANAGLATAVALLAFVLGTGLRRTAVAVALAIAANAPWVFSGLLHASWATTDAAGASSFGLHGAGPVPAPIAALALGGIWNSEVVLPSRHGLLGWGYVILVVGLVLLGIRPWLRVGEARDRLGLFTCWGVGYALALMTWLAPGVVRALLTGVPGGGALRDGARALALCAPLLAVLAAEGAGVLARRPSGAALRIATAGSLVVLPVTLLPDAGLGLSGRLEAHTYPAAYAEARTAISSAASSGAHGDLLVLPLSSYRAPGWNGGRKVLDPVGRYLSRDYVASDELVVSGIALPGEDPRVRSAAAALELPDAHSRAVRLADLGIGFVATEPDAAGASAEVGGELLVDGPDLRVVRIDETVRDRGVPTDWVIVMSVAWLLYVGLFVWAVAVGGARLVQTARSRRPRARIGGSAP